VGYLKLSWVHFRKGVMMNFCEKCLGVLDGVSEQKGILYEHDLNGRLYLILDITEEAKKASNNIEEAIKLALPSVTFEAVVKI